MKTGPLDFLLSTLCIAILLCASVATVWLLSLDHPYHVVLDVAVFLLAYGLYSGLLLAVLQKIQPYPIGRFSMHSTEFTRWKLYAVLTDLAMKALMPFTTVFTQALIHALLGADVGKQVAFGGVLRDLPLLCFADLCTIGQNSVIVAHLITHDEIFLQPVKIGKNAVVGINCTVMPGVTLGENAILVAGSVAVVGTLIPANEMWGGTPARKIKDLGPIA